MTSEFTISVHALVLLNRKQTTVSSEVIAENVCTNPARIRKVMARLKKAGLVETKEGLDGGYHFIQNPASVTLKMVAEALDESFVSASWRSGAPNMKCLIASGMNDVLSQIYENLNECCRNYLDGITIADIDGQIFSTQCVKTAPQ